MLLCVTIGLILQGGLQSINSFSVTITSQQAPNHANP